MKQTKRTLLSLLLVFAMLATCLVAFSLTTSAANPTEDIYKDGTLPEGAEVKTGTATSFSGGDGTAENPYQIKDVTEFRYLQQMISEDSTYLTKCYVLTGNLYYNDKVFPEYSEDHLPDGTADTITSVDSTANRYQSDNTKAGAITGTFSGTFDGAGYGIYNSFMRFANAGGFFQTVTGTVKNLNFYGGYVYQKQVGSYAPGGSIVATLNGGTISNCYSSVGVESDYTSRIGGIVGLVNGTATIENCVYAGAISANNGSSTTDYQVGGIVGRVQDATLTVSGCKNYAPIVTRSARIGGIVGFSIRSNVALTDCANYGNVKGTSTVGDGGLGGIMGRNYTSTNTVSFTRCANYGDVTTSSSNNGRAGGIVGTTAGNESLISCANYGDITGDSASGIVAYATTCTISNCYSEGTMTNLNSGNGSCVLAGWVKSTTTVQNCVGVTSSKLYGDNDGTTVASNNKTYPAGDAALTNGEALAILNTDNDGVWAQGATAPFLKVFATQVAIEGATLSLRDTMTMKLVVKASSVTEIYNLKSIMVNDGTEDYEGTLNTKTGTYD
ncbi:MAG: hypothetical protein ACI4SP_04885, partial [Eubacteriales bacterium]